MPRTNGVCTLQRAWPVHYLVCYFSSLPSLSIWDSINPGFVIRTHLPYIFVASIHEHLRNHVRPALLVR